MGRHPLDRVSQLYRCVAMAALLAALIGDVAGQEHAFHEYEEGGLLVAENTGGPLFDGDLYLYEEVCVLTQDPDQLESLVYTTGRFAWSDKGFFMDADGRFFVRDQGNQRIAVFDPSGRFERSIGRGGEGPGEFGQSLELIRVGGGEIEIYDPGPRRFTRFSSDGELLDTVQAPTIGFQTRHDREADLFTVIDSNVQMGPETITYDVGFRTVRSDGSIVGEARTEAVPGRYAYPWETRTGVAWESIPLVAQPFSAWTPDGGILLATGVDPIVRWYGVDGTLVKEITLDLAPSPIIDRDLDQHFQTIAEEAQAEGNPREAERLRRMRVSVKHPDHRSYWEFMTVDDRGLMWLEVLESPRERAERGGILYHVLSPDGEFLGATRAPAAGRVMRGHLLGIVTDAETAEEHYTVWRMIPRHNVPMPDSP